MNKKILIPLAIFGGALAMAAVPAIKGVRFATEARAQDAQPDPQAVDVISKFLRALQTGDEEQRVKATIPYLQRSLLTEDGSDIEPSVKRVQFKKASMGANSYAVPVKITRIRSKGNITIGEGSDNAEKGRAEDYFIAKKEGASGLPASVTIFFPENGAPRVLYMGSL